jgi:hypothetical protein
MPRSYDDDGEPVQARDVLDDEELRDLAESNRARRGPKRYQTWVPDKERDE